MSKEFFIIKKGYGIEFTDNNFISGNTQKKGVGDLISYLNLVKINTNTKYFASRIFL